MIYNITFETVGLILFLIWLFFDAPAAVYLLYTNRKRRKAQFIQTGFIPYVVKTYEKEMFEFIANRRYDPIVVVVNTIKQLEAISYQLEALYPGHVGRLSGKQVGETRWRTLDDYNRGLICILVITKGLAGTGLYFRENSHVAILCRLHPDNIHLKALRHKVTTESTIFNGGLYTIGCLPC